MTEIKELYRQYEYTLKQKITPLTAKPLSCWKKIIFLHMHAKPSSAHRLQIVKTASSHTSA